MIELIRLKSILKSFSIDELFHIKRNLLLVDGSKSLNSTSRVLDILTSNAEIDTISISLVLYEKKNYVALKKLLQRVTDKILEALVSKELLHDKNYYDKRAREVFNIRRKLLYYDVLAAHGVTNYALIILNQVISIAQKIEYYDYLLISLEKKMIKMSLRDGERKFGKVYNDIVYYSDCNSSLKYCIYLLRLYSTNFDYKQKLFNNDKLKLAIGKIKLDIKRTKSKSIRLYLFYLEGIYFTNNEMYFDCRSNFIKCLRYLGLHPNIFYDSYFVSCLINISEMDTMLWNFENSLKSLNKIIFKFSKSEFNDKLIKEMLFFNYFYLGDLKMASKYVRLLIEFKLPTLISSFLTAKRYFYLAVICNLQGFFNESNKLLTNCQSLDKDKDGWNVGVRILSIINNIELEKFDYAESQIENLRKHMSRVKNDSNFYARLLIITNILVLLGNNSFNFVFVSIKHIMIINKLKENNLLTRWILKSPEMIIFHEWFDAKVKGVSYDHTEVMKRLRKNNLSRKL